MNHEPGFHLSCDEHLSEGWGPPLPYSVPYQLVHERIEARYTTTTVELFYNGRPLTAHRRRYDGQPSTKPEHMPSAHRAHAE